MLKSLVWSEKTRILIVFITLISFKILLLKTGGYLEDTDEEPFLALLNNFDLLISLDSSAWVYQVENWWSTYFETLIRLPQAWILKSYAEYNGFSTTSPEALHIIGFINAAISFTISFFQYKVLRRLEFSTSEALLGTILVATLLNTNLYLTHILPYDSSLLFHFIALYAISSKELSKRKILLSGFFSALGFFNYYGNFPFIFIVWGFILFRLYPNTLRLSISSLRINIDFRILLKSFIFFIPIIGVLVGLQTLSLAQGFSYIKFLQYFSKTIYHGSPDETLSYVFLYFNLVEGFWGMALLLLSTASLLYIKLHKKVVNNHVIYLFIAAILIYLTYGLQGIITGEMVFYGRVLHLFYFFIILGVLLIQRAHHRIKYLLWVGAIANMFFVHSELNSLGFPRSVMSTIGINGSYSDAQFLNELEPSTNHSYRDLLDDGEHIEEKKLFIKPFANSDYEDGGIIMKNFSFFKHYPNSFMKSYKQINIPEGYNIIYSKLHFMSHPAYTFEYCTREGRDFFIETKVRLEVYENEN